MEDNMTMQEMQATMQEMQKTMLMMQETINQYKLRSELFGAFAEAYQPYTVSYEKKYHLFFKPPKTIDAILELIGELAFPLNLYFALADKETVNNFNLFQWVTSTNPEGMWQLVAKYIYIKNEGLEHSLSVAKEEYLDPAMVLEAFGLFFESIESLNIPAVYLINAKGITTRAVQKIVMARDIVLNNEIDPKIDVMELMGRIMGEVINTESVIAEEKRR